MRVLSSRGGQLALQGMGSGRLIAVGRDRRLAITASSSDGNCEMAWKRGGVRQDVALPYAVAC
jgi:hypothetical protein